MIYIYIYIINKWDVISDYIEWHTINDILYLTWNTMNRMVCVGIWWYIMTYDDIYNAMPWYTNDTHDMTWYDMIWYDMIW